MFFVSQDQGYSSASVCPTKQVCPDVSRLCVDSEDALEARAERRHGRSVAVKQEVVVLQPIWEHVVRYDAPPAFPHLIGDERCTGKTTFSSLR